MCVHVLLGPLFDLRVYGLRAKGSYRDGCVYYGAEHICKEIGLEDVPKEELFKDWPEEFVVCFRVFVAVFFIIILHRDKWRI